MCFSISHRIWNAGLSYFNHQSFQLFQSSEDITLESTYYITEVNNNRLNLETFKQDIYFTDHRHVHLSKTESTVSIAKEDEKN